jgi:protein-tyrosine phosphatase
VSTQVSAGCRYRVCFVCTGNICRSPMAEWVTRAGLARLGIDELVDVDSAGIGDWHVGQPADERATRVALDAGYTHASSHIARQFRREWLGERDLVIALDSGHARALRAMAHTHPSSAPVRLLREYDKFRVEQRLDVDDPYYGGIAEFERCLRVIEAACEGLLAEIGSVVTRR